MDEITEDYENFISTSAVLHYCKHKILRPYLRLLGVMGLKPTSSDESDHFLWYSILTNLHTFQVIIFICIGYILQYMACFRQVYLKYSIFACVHVSIYVCVRACTRVCK